MLASAPSDYLSTPPRTWAEIDLTALRQNLAAIRARVGVQTGVIAIIKANAYGHGAAAIAQALAGEVQMFGVANLIEAREVRMVVPDLPVMILGPALPEERCAIAAERFLPLVSDLEEATAYSSLATADPLEIHVKIDTGMGRIGVWQEEARDAVRAIRELPGVRVTGVATHLPVADEDAVFTREQLEHFEEIVSALRLDGLVAPLVHVENSAGAIGFPAHAGDLVRPGLALYGCSPIPDFQPNLRPVMTWKTRVILVRRVGPGRDLSYGRTFTTRIAMQVATLAVGYADGYRRHLSGADAAVLIRGQRCAVLGRVTMDQILVDVTALPGVAAGEEVVLLGRQGNEEITVRELAQKAGTIPWEIFTGIGPRVVRRITGNRL